MDYNNWWWCIIIIDDVIEVVNSTLGESKHRERETLDEFVVLLQLQLNGLAALLYLMLICVSFFLLHSRATMRSCSSRCDGFWIVARFVPPWWPHSMRSDVEKQGKKSSPTHRPLGEDCQCWTRLLLMKITQFKSTPILGIDRVAMINGWCIKKTMMGARKGGSS
jgi:hypothetical protein